MVPKVSPENAELNLSANLSSALPTFTVSGLDPGSKYVGELVGHNVKGMCDFVFDYELSFTCGPKNSFFVISPAHFYCGTKTSRTCKKLICFRYHAFTVDKLEFFLKCLEPDLECSNIAH